MLVQSMDVKEAPRRAQLTLRNTAFQTRIERIAAKQRQQLRLALELLILRVMIAQSLEPCDASHRLKRAGLDVVDIVVVKDAKIWWWGFVIVRAVEAAAGVGDAFWFWWSA
jgi:hypothetical protein